ncbi:hypothetical protein [Olivibacter domesticus]|uniref:Uncharacterized protein n=1 Tax=Olivibacter domesticus TaxID=407022 RepID=A0A1H7QAZ3_OLID1|nr:hypothetical protein [Olivibacter domesticus]SEL45331.1 hypothetical protein SAMN05661044_02533 [Olivibacter domesticus]
MIPQDFETWRDCITVKCGITLSPAFARQRLAIYRQKAHTETTAFIRLYGSRHYQNIVAWLETIEKGA